MSHLEACVDSCLPFVPLCTVIHPISLFSAAATSPSLFYVSTLCFLAGIQKRHTGSGWGPSFETGFKHSSMGVVTGVEEVAGGGYV